MTPTSDTSPPTRTICGVTYTLGACPPHVVASIQMSPVSIDHPKFWERLAKASYEVTMLGHKPKAVWFEIDLTGWWWLHIETQKLKPETLSQKDGWLKYLHLMRSEVDEALKTTNTNDTK